MDENNEFDWARGKVHELLVDACLALAERHSGMEARWYRFLAGEVTW